MRMKLSSPVSRSSRSSFSEFHTPRPIAGRRIVFAGFVLAIFAWGFGFYGLSVYTQFLGVQGRWTLAQMSAATTVYFVAGSIFIGLSDRLSGRLGRKRVALLGIVSLVCGSSYLPFAESVYLLFAAYLIMAFGWASTSGTAITQIVGAWFDRQRGLAVSLALTGASVAGFTVVPAMVWLINHWGSTTGIALTACLFGLVAALAVASLADQPEQATNKRAAGNGPATGSVPRWSLAQLVLVMIFSLGLLAQVIFLAHQLPILTPRIGADRAALAVGITTAAALGGRLLLGFFSDRVDHRRMLAACFVSQISGLTILLLGDSAFAVFSACVLFGLSVGNLITLPALFVQREYPPAQFGAVVSRIWSCSQFFYAFGPLAAGLLIEASGSRDSALMVCVLLQLMATALCVGVGAPQQQAGTAHNQSE